MRFSPDGKSLYQTVHRWGFLYQSAREASRTWDTVAGRMIGGPMLDETSGGFRPDGRAFLTLGKDGIVKLRDGVTGAVVSRLMAASSPTVCAAFRGDGRLVAVGCQDGSVRLCDPNASQPIGPSRFMEHSVIEVAFTPDGSSVAGIDIAGNSRRWPIPHALLEEDMESLRLRVEARTGLHMENDHSIAARYLRLARPPRAARPVRSLLAAT